jgi:DMSO/TMAO reductase YedYZ molybdopterin-dependent catalytic subunit
VSRAGRWSGFVGPFSKGFSAGLITLILWFIVRLGGLAPFPPESALVYLFSVIPESIQEPAVQNLGEMAGLLGLALAVLVGAAAYGLLGVVYERYYLPRAGKLNSLSRLENTLVFSLVPWLFFGVLVLPLTGGSFFGIGSDFASPGIVWVFPLTTLMFQLLWGVLLWGRTSTPPATMSGAAPGPVEGLVPRDPIRRTFIERAFVLAGSAVLVLASLGSALGALASEGGLVSEEGASIRPGTSIDLQGAPAIFANPQLAPLVNSEVTSNDSFYRVAIDLFDPSVDASTWSLSLVGLIANPKVYSLPSLKSLPKVQEYDTFICVSNTINGDLISNAKWGGVRLSDLFADAGGVSPDATYAVFYSIDGYSVGVPIARAIDPVSMLAYEMNDADLPPRHGYPLRAVIPGLYGMMSAKWVRQVELSDSVYVGFWQTRGWSNDAAVQTVAFIRVPQDGATVSLSQTSGSVLLGGVAFAGDRGISKVEVSVDGGTTWEAATLKPPASNLTWVLWAYEWRPQGPGNYVIYARATDGEGELQTSAQADTYPSGATGYVMSTVNVTS